MERQKKLRIGVLFGGRSGEHEVSFCSAASVIEAINTEKYEVVPIGITKEGYWLSPEESSRALVTKRVEGNEFISWESKTVEHQFLVMSRKGKDAIYSFLEKLDVIFPVLHGPYGEDGTIQGLLELLDIPYVGSGVAASALAMDKELMKNIFLQAGLPHIRWLMVKRKRWHKKSEQEKILNEIENHLRYPLFVKPANLGSSVGVSKVKKRLELTPALENAALYDRKILIEEGIEDNIEVECSVLGNDEPEVSVVGEIKPAGEFYDYNSKYIDEGTQLIIPARIPDKVASLIRIISKQAFTAIDGAGFARVDFFVQKRNNIYRIYLNEINTIPGFTRASMFPKLWEKSGINFSDLIDRLIQLALERYQDKSSNKKDYPSILLEK